MFSDRLRAARIHRERTLQETADAIGITLRTYQKYEGGNVYPDYDRLVCLADFLNISLDFLFGRDDYLKSLGVVVDVPQAGPPRRPKPQRSRQTRQIQPADNTAD